MRQRLFLMLAIAPSVAAGQTLEQRIAGARGTVAFEYETRPNVCGDGNGVTISDDSSAGWTTSRRRSGVHIGRHSGRGYGRCETGPARVWLRRDGSGISELHVAVGGAPRAADTDLGEVAPGTASRWLLDVAPRLAGSFADAAILGAEIADAASPWPRLLQIARDDGASESARKSSLFWLSQHATTAAAAGLAAVAADDDASLPVRQDALFYLAQRPDGEGIPALVRVVETSSSVKLRKDAIFYLSQSGDARALALFERLLAGK